MIWVPLKFISWLTNLLSDESNMLSLIMLTVIMTAGTMVMITIAMIYLRTFLYALSSKSAFRRNFMALTPMKVARAMNTVFMK